MIQSILKNSPFFRIYNLQLSHCLTVFILKEDSNNNNNNFFEVLCIEQCCERNLVERYEDGRFKIQDWGKGRSRCSVAFLWFFRVSIFCVFLFSFFLSVFSCYLLYCFSCFFLLFSFLFLELYESLFLSNINIYKSNNIKKAKAKLRVMFELRIIRFLSATTFDMKFLYFHSVIFLVYFSDTVKSSNSNQNNLSLNFIWKKRKFDKKAKEISDN
jgi:hypothetical protein